MNYGALAIALLFGLCLFIAYDKGRLAQAQGALMIGAASLTLAVAALFVAPRGMRRAPYLGLAALAALMTLDLAISNKPNESTGLPSFIRIRPMRRWRSFASGSPPTPPPTGVTGWSWRRWITNGQIWASCMVSTMTSASTPSA